MIMSAETCNNDFKFCPLCGWTNIKNCNNRKWICNCGFELFNNVAAASWIIIQDKLNNVLFEVRAKDPKKWFLSLPGWFIEPNEDLQIGTIRECREEIGLKVENLKYLCSYPNTYIYNNIEYKTCDIYFLVDIWDMLVKDIVDILSIQKSEITKLEYYKINTVGDIDKLPIAFESAKYALKYNLDNK